MNYEEEYLKKKELLTENILRTKERIEKDLQEYEEIKENDSTDNKEKYLEVLKNKIIRLQNYLHLLKMERKYSRPGTRETEIEKSRLYDNFAKDLKELLSSKYHYCFHGCRYIYLVKEIIESGILSSSVDRFGLETSYDVDNQISVTTIDTLETTMSGYAGLTNSPTQPAGAVFVLSPKDENEVESSNRMIIGSINFKEEPNRLKCILTTSENKEKITKWCMENSVDFEKVLTYDEFLGLLSEKRQKKNL